MMTESNIKVCKDCKHYYYGVFGKEQYVLQVCNHPEVIKPKTNLVTGEKFSSVRECHRERSIEGGCGLEARRWEACDE